MTVLAWLCIGLGLAFSVPQVAKISRGNWPGADELARIAAKGEAWRNLLSALTAVAVGLEIFGFHKHGPWGWASGLPVVALVALNAIWGITIRMRSRTSRPTS